jgi:hypothetical protein
MSINELKNKSGTISDYVGLHDKIRGVETELQELGVDLGNFNSENEFCTLHFSLFEGHERKAVSLLQRIKIAFEWAVKYYAVAIVAICGVLLGSFLLLRVVDRMKLLTAFFPRSNP